MLKLNEGHVNIINAQMMNGQDLIMKCFHYHEFELNGYLYKKSPSLSPTCTKIFSHTLTH